MSVVVTATAQTALPTLAHDASEIPPTKRAAWSDRTATLMATLCELTYAHADRWPEVQALLAAGGFALAVRTGRAVLAVSPQLAVLAWRGTDSLGDWKLDLSARRVALPGAQGLRVHEGFLAAFQEDRAAVEVAISTHLPPDVPLYITGHSLGGAVAQISAAAFDCDALAACYTFGSPRVGTLAFKRIVHTPHYRVVNGWDIVPGVPAPFWRGYRHTGDVRLLVPGQPEALDRDRSVPGRFVVDVAAGLTALVTRRLPVVDDHMIWNYRARLEAIAQARAKPPHPAA